MAIAIPSFYLSAELRARYKMQDEMRSVQTAVEAWGNEHGKFPLTDDELRKSLAGARVDGESPFQRAGKPVPYKQLLILIPGSLWLKTPCTESPGTVCYTVDSSGTHYWLTATTLPRPVSREVVPLAESPNAPQFVISGEAEPPSPAVEPAKAKIETKK